MAINHKFDQPGGLVCNVSIDVETFTKDQAEKAIAQKADCQRNLKRWRQSQMKSDLEEGQWWFTGAPIVFDDAGRLIDGQHRLTTMINTGVFPPTLVVRGVLRDAYLAIDCNSPKTLGDYFKFLGVNNANSASAAARYIARYEESENGEPLKSGSEIPRSRIEYSYRRWEREIQQAIKATKSVSRFVGGTGIAASAYALSCEAMGEEFTSEAFRAIETGIHDHGSCRQIHDLFRVDNNKPRRQFSPDARFLAMLKAFSWAYGDSRTTRVWPNACKVTKPLSK